MDQDNSLREAKGMLTALFAGRVRREEIPWTIREE